MMAKSRLNDKSVGQGHTYTYIGYIYIYIYIMFLRISYYSIPIVSKLLMVQNQFSEKPKIQSINQVLVLKVRSLYHLPIFTGFTWD